MSKESVCHSPGWQMKCLNAGDKRAMVKKLDFFSPEHFILCSILDKISTRVQEKLKKHVRKTDLSILQKSKSHLESRALTVVDLKIMDSQSFEYCYTGFVDVERLTQLCICSTVHSANLKKNHKH